MSEVDEYLHFAERIIVPSSLEARVIKQFRDGHQVISTMKPLPTAYKFPKQILRARG